MEGENVYKSSNLKKEEQEQKEGKENDFNEDLDIPDQVKTQTLMADKDNGSEADAEARLIRYLLGTDETLDITVKDFLV